jgi:hypothetical protein
MRDGFPVEMNRDNCKPQAANVEHQEQRHPKCGFLASPAVGRLEGDDKPADIVIPALDGHLYAYDGDGNLLPHYPIQLVDPSVPDNEKVIAESINNVAIGDLNKDHVDDVVAASNEVYGAAPPGDRDIAGLFSQALADLLANVTDTSTRVYAIDGKTGKFMNGWPIKLNGGIQNVLPLIGPGHDPAIMQVGGETEIVVSSTGGALSLYDIDGQLDRAMQQSLQGPGSLVSDKTGALNLFESASVGDIDGSGKPSIVKYNTTLAGAANLLLVGQNFPWQHMIGAFDPSSGTPRAGFPVVFDDYQFLSSSTIAKMQPGGSNQVIAGSGLGLLHAYDGKTGAEIPEFPKVTGGWLFAPATLRSDGRTAQMAGITREGYLFRWRTQTTTCQSEWPDFRHDPHHTGNYDADGRAPAAVRELALSGTTLSWKAPGDDGICGTAKRYVVTADGQAVSGPTPATAGTTQSMTVPAAREYRVQAVDDAGNYGPAAVVRVTGDGVTGDGPSPGTGSGSDLPVGPGISANSQATPQTTACAVTAGFSSASAKARKRGLSIDFSAGGPVDVDVIQVSKRRTPIADKRLAHFGRRSKGFSWSGKGASDGYFVLKLTRGADVRRIGLRRSHGRFRRLGLTFDYKSCGPIAGATLARPVFGGSKGKAAGLSVRLSQNANIAIDVIYKGKRVRHMTQSGAKAGRTYKFGIGAGKLKLGDYAVKITAAGKTVTLAARRL